MGNQQYGADDEVREMPRTKQLELSNVFQQSSVSTIQSN